MDIKIPEVGESVREALLAKWFKKEGEQVEKDEPVCEIETDKITLDLHADIAGILSIVVAEGNTLKVGSVIGRINRAESPAVIGVTTSQTSINEPPPPTSPSVRQELRQAGITAEAVSGSGKMGRIMPEDIESHLEKIVAEPSATTLDIPAVHSEEPPPYLAGRLERRPMSPLRKKISERLLAARQQTAMLTTFNEADLTEIIKVRRDRRDGFIRKHGQPLGLMPFFVKACIAPLKEFPLVNASIEGDDIVYHHYFDIGVAIGGDKGLVVPVLRSADQLGMHEIDMAIASYKEKISTNRLAISDLEGATFTISNGGVYGSMLSTPILNPPQSAVLGMHAILDRPVVRDGEIVIRPMMYLALSYDHRIIDGRDAVGFLKKVKEGLEQPEGLPGLLKAEGEDV